VTLKRDRVEETLTREVLLIEIVVNSMLVASCIVVYHRTCCCLVRLPCYTHALAKSNVFTFIRKVKTMNDT